PLDSIKNFGHEIEKPRHTEKTGKRVGHRLQRFVLARSGKHLARDHSQQKQQQHCCLEFVGIRQAKMGEVVETAAQKLCAADHGGEFEIRQPALIEHAVKFAQRKQAERTD